MKLSRVHNPRDSKKRQDIVAIVQARMTSRRLPGKILLPLGKYTVLELVVERLRQSHQVDEVLVATSADASDDAVENECKRIGVRLFRGSLNDVLDRYVQASRQVPSSLVVRITADCPLIDPDVVDEVVLAALAGGWDYGGLGGEFPDGLDCECIRPEALVRASELSTLRSDREHVTPFMKRNPEIFRCGEVRLFDGLGHVRWTLDEPADYNLLVAMCSALDIELIGARTADFLSVLRDRPELANINAAIVRNEGYLRLVEQERDDGDGLLRGP